MNDGTRIRGMVLHAFAVVVVARGFLETLSMLNNLYKVPDLFKTSRIASLLIKCIAMPCWIEVIRTSNMFQRVMGLFLLKCLSTNA